MEATYSFPEGHAGGPQKGWNWSEWERVSASFR